MKRRFLVISILTILLISICVPAFAMENMANGIRNFVGGTENVIENAGNTVSNGIKNGLNTVGAGTENVMTDVRDGMNNTQNSMTAGMTTNNNNGGVYTATRTTTDNATFAGMSTNTWTWIIIGITALAIGLLIWSYMKQRNKNDLYIDSDDE